MNENFAIQLFEGKKVRIVWDAEQEKYYFSVTDKVQVLTDSVNPRDYIKKMLRCDLELKSMWGTICTLLKCWLQMAAIRKRKSKVYVTKRWHVLAIINKNLPFTLYKKCNFVF